MKALKLLTIAALLLVAGAVRAQWQPVFGPTGGDVEAIASDGAGHVYAGTDSGVYMSGDNGLTWTQELSGLTNREIFSFAITPNGTVLAGTEGGGIFRTTNFGSYWDSSSSGLPNSSNILSLASDGHGNLYAGHSMLGVFYSSDDGMHWTARNADMDSQTIFSLTVAPNGTVYAGGNRYIFSSNDQGVHWDTSLNTVYSGDEVLALAADSAGDIFAGTFLKQRFRLLIGHSAWEPITPFTTNTGDEVRTIAAVNDRIFLGMFGNGIVESGDFGSTWSDFSGGLTDPKVYSLTASPDGYLFAGTYLAEVFREDLGLSVRPGSGSQNTVDVWPQPCSDVVHISFSNSGVSNMRMFDGVGREVKDLSTEVVANDSHTVTLNTSQLPSGVYRITVDMPDGISSAHIIVQH